MMKKIGITGSVIAMIIAAIFVGFHVNNEFTVANAAGDNKPIVQTAPVTDVTGTSALLHGIVNINDGTNGHVWFEYGTNPTAPVYADAWPSKVGDQSVWTNGDNNLAVFLSGLTPNTTYYYKIKAENSAGVTEGSVMNFKTTATTATLACANGTTLSLDEAVTAYHSGKITMAISLNDSGLTGQAVITNNTGCAFPVSFTSYQVFDQVLSHQVLFNTTGSTTVAANSTKTLSTTLPNCMAQTDVVFGAASNPISPNDYAFTAKFNRNTGSSYTDAAGPFCQHTVLPPPTCPNTSGTLTLTETQSAITSGKIKITLANSTTENKSIGTIQNDTDCNVPVSQVTYKMFDQQLGTQTFFDYAPNTASTTVVAAHTSATLKTNLPVCMAQTDFYYGAGPLQLFNDNRAANITLAYIFLGNTGNSYSNAAGNFCSNYVPPVATSTLTLIKQVINDNGGTKVPTDFALFVNTTQVQTGSTTLFAAGTYKASETNLAGYTAGTWTGDCAADGTVTLNAGDHKTCTIVNNDIPPTTGGCTSNCGGIAPPPPSGGCISNCGGIAPRPPTGGCTANCGGVTVTTSTPPPGQVAGVFLSQVPYTGIGSNLKIALFMLALFSWSAWISYLIIKRKAKKSGISVADMFAPSMTSNGTMAFAGGPSLSTMNRVQASIPVMTTAPVADITATPVAPKTTSRTFVKSPFLEHMNAPVQAEASVPNLPTDDTYSKIFNRVNESASAVAAPAVAPVASKYEPAMTPVKSEMSVMPTVAKPQAQIVLPSHTEDVMGSLEIRARELQTLVSADGLEIIAKAAQNNKHNAVIILNHLVELYKGSEHEVEGDWMVLNGDKISQILFSTYITMTPVFVAWLAQGDEKKAMAFVRMLQMQGQTVKDFVMNIVIELDKAYRFRVENMGDADAAILDATMNWSNQELETVIHTLVTAVDQTYSSTYASVKIALVKVLDLAKTKLYA